MVVVLHQHKEQAGAHKLDVSCRSFMLGRLYRGAPGVYSAWAGMLKVSLLKALY
jgi:hypothetical protein